MCGHPVQEHRLDCVLDRLGAGVDDEMARRSGRRNPIQRRFHAQRQHGLVFGMRVAVGDERQRVEDGVDDRGIVFAERVRGDERAHVEKAVRLTRVAAIDDRKIRPDRLGGIEGDRQRIEQAVRCRGERTGRERKQHGHQAFERFLTVAQPRRYVGADLPGPVPGIELCDVVEKSGGAIETGGDGVHPPHRSPPSGSRVTGGDQP